MKMKLKERLILIKGTDSDGVRFYADYSIFFAQDLTVVGFGRIVNDVRCLTTALSDNPETNSIAFTLNQILVDLYVNQFIEGVADGSITEAEPKQWKSCLLIVYSDGIPFTYNVPNDATVSEFEYGSGKEFVNHLLHGVKDA